MVAEVQARLSGYLEDCVDGPVTITKNSGLVVVLNTISDPDELEQLILARTA